MDWDKFKQTLCDDLRPNAIDATNPYVTINSVMPMVKFQAAEITRLKTELELRTKERDQATKHMEVADNEVHILKEFVGYAQIGSKTTTPDLYAHLAGKVKDA